MSLEQLSRGTMLTTSFLSQLERNKVNVSVDNLRKIADFLDVKMVRFFDGDEGPMQGMVTRKGHGVALKIEGSTVHSESLIRRSNSNIQATLYRNPPGEGRKSPFSHRGEEFVHVIKGEVLFSLNTQEYHLKEGDSMYYRSELHHSWVNPSEDESVILVFNSPQVW
jgi:quercetin dioxygenase-like cupin family protein